MGLEVTEGQGKKKRMMKHWRDYYRVLILYWHFDSTGETEEESEAIIEIAQRNKNTQQQQCNCKFFKHTPPRECASIYLLSSKRSN